MVDCCFQSNLQENFTRENAVLSSEFISTVIGEVSIDVSCMLTTSESAAFGLNAATQPVRYAFVR
jgi:hypothetical protein